MPPILRQRRSLRADAKEMFGVRSFFAINAQVHNSLHSEYHQEVKLGFRCESTRKRKRGPRLRPLPPGAPQVRVTADIEPLMLFKRKTKPLPGLGEPVSPSAQAEEKPKAAGSQAGGSTSITTQKSKKGSDKNAASGGSGSYDQMVKDVRHTSTELHDLKTKARSGLLDAKRNGDLERLASEMEQKLLEKADEVAAIGDRARKEAEGSQNAVRSEAKAVTDDLNAIKAKARQNLLKAKRDGDLERVADEMEAELQRKLEELNAIKKKARGSLLNAHKTGELNTLAAEMEAAQQEIQAQVTAMAEIKQKARTNLLNAKKTGELEALAAGMDKILNEPVEIDMGAVKQKARKNLLDAKRNGELEAIANEMDDAAKKIEEKKQELAQVRAKAKKGLLAAKQSGDLERLASEYEVEMEAKAAELHALKEQARENFGAETAEAKAAVAQLDAAERAMKAQAAEFHNIKEKARRGLIDAKRTGELEKICGSMDRIMAEGEQNMEEATKRANEVKAKAKKGLLEARKSGELQALADEMEQAELELKAKAAAFREVKEKAKRGLLDASRKGELESLAQGMEQTVARIEEAQAKMERLQETKSKASKGLLQAKRDGTLEKLAEGM